MTDMSDIERLRAQNSSLLKVLQTGQHNLRASIRSTIAGRGSPSNELPKNNLREKPAELNVRFQRDPLNLSTVSSIRHTNSSGHRKRLTSTPKYSNPSAETLENLDRPPRPTTDPTQTDTPNRLYQSFLSESSSAFGHSPENSLLQEAEKRTTTFRRRGTSKSASGRRKGSIQRKSPKSRPQTALPSFTPNQNSRGSRAVSVQLETSSLLPRPLSEKENIRGHGSRYGYRRPLELAHEESYYQMNSESPQVTKEGRLQRSFAGQLLADGNDRQQTRNLVATRPKSILSTPGTKMNKSRNRVSFRGSPNASMFDPDADALNETSSRTQPLLGYDWIAGLLDSDSPTNEQSEDFFEELRQFRQANREECVHKSLMEEPNITASFQMTTAHIDEEAADVDKHTCIHNYTLNPRLFAVPLHGTQYGESLCAICNDRRKSKQPATTSPSYIRVSIPRSTLASPYKIRPHRRKSYDPTDSVGLSQHCLAGWESSKPSMLPTASNIDLKDSVNKMGSNVLNLMSYPAQDQTFQESRSGQASRISKHTQDLLNRSHALQLDLQKLERVGMSVARLPPRPNSSSYPVV